jgi:hypothetical protein
LENQCAPDSAVGRLPELMPELMPDAGANAEALTLPVTRALIKGTQYAIPFRPAAA